MDIKKAYTKYQVIYYSKFYCKLNHIEYFQYNRKSLARRHYKYSIERLKEDIPKTLAKIKKSTILGYYISCLKKIKLYNEIIKYIISKQKKLTSHQKIQVINNNK